MSAIDKIDLYVFSGTGNTLYAAKCMKEFFLQQNLQCRLLPITAQTVPQAVANDTMIGIGFPIACFCTYPVVLDFIHKLPETAGGELFFFSTMGGSDGCVDAQLLPEFRNKGYKVRGYEAFVMPSNFMQHKIVQEKNDELLAICEKRTHEFCKKVLAGEEFRYSRSFAAKFYHWIFHVAMESGFVNKTFKVKVNTEKCTGCGLCQRICPVGAALVDNGVVSISSACQDCMRCVGFCPENALRVHKAKPYSGCTLQEFNSSFDI